MKRINTFGAFLAVVVLAGAIFAFAEKAPSTQPSKSAHWGFAPYNKLTNVTDDQKAKINDIHRKANAERSAIDDKEDADVMALLTPEQKAELDKMKADKKAKDAEKRAEKKKETDDKDEKDKDK